MLDLESRYQRASLNMDLVVERGTFAHYDTTVLFGNGDLVPMTLFEKRELERKHLAGSLALLTLKPGDQRCLPTVGIRYAQSAYDRD